MGHPIPAVPVRGPHHVKPDIIPGGPGPYGPPRPIYPGKYGPPPGPGFRPPRPHGPKPYPIYEKPGYEAISGPGLLDQDLPPFIDDGHHKVHSDKSTVVVNAQGGSGPGGVQQHVHHHYHHGSSPSGPGKPVIVERPVPVPVPSSVHGHPPASVYETGPGFTGAFNGINGGQHGIYGSGFGGSYLNGQPPFYKKELNLNRKYIYDMIINFCQEAEDIAIMELTSFEFPQEILPLKIKFETFKQQRWRKTFGYPRIMR